MEDDRIKQVRKQKETDVAKKKKEAKKELFDDSNSERGRNNEMNR